VKLQLEQDLLLTQLEVRHQQSTIHFKRVLVDTGSGTTLLSRSLLKDAGIILHIEDEPLRIRGVGGSEMVFQKKFDAIWCGEFQVTQFKAQLSLMKYGVEIDGILGLDFLRAIDAVIDLKNLEIRQAI
jgi:hypothetical protein